MNVKKSVRAVVYLILISAISYVSMVSGAPPDRPDFLQNLPPWELHEAPPQVNYTKPPVHFLIDENGTAFRKKVVVDDTGAYKVTEELVASKVLKAIRKLRHVALIDKQIANQNDAPPPDPSELAATCPLSSSFSIMFNADGEAYGNEGFDYTSKPAEANTQWLTFDFYTEDYRGKASHVPIALWFDTYLYGWGGLIGDNHADIWDRGCGDTALFNSQIEGFTCPSDIDYEFGCNNAVFNGPESCGNEMYDGPVVIFPGYSVPRYRMEMQASVGHWVAYRIFEYDSANGWEILTDWKSVDVDTGTYMPDGIQAEWLDRETQGIFIGATDSAAAADSSLHLSNVDCGWF